MALWGPANATIVDVGHITLLWVPLCALEIGQQVRSDDYMGNCLGDLYSPVFSAPLAEICK